MSAHICGSNRCQSSSMEHRKEEPRARPSQRRSGALEVRCEMRVVSQSGRQCWRRNM